MLIGCRQNYTDTFFPILNRLLASKSYSLDISEERLPNCMCGNCMCGLMLFNYKEYLSIFAVSYLFNVFSY